MNGTPARADRTDGEGGFSLLEVLIAAVVLFLIIAMAATIIGNGNRLYTTVALRSETEMKAANLGDQIADRLRGGFIASLRDAAGNFIPDGGSSTTGFSVRLYAGYQGTPLAGDTVRFVVGNGEVDVSDGKDNDGDNYVDERDLRLRIWRPGQHNLPLDPLGIPALALPVQDVRLTDRVKRVLLTRAGRVLTITVEAMKFDPTLSEVVDINSTVTVTLKN